MSVADRQALDLIDHAMECVERAKERQHAVVYSPHVTHESNVRAEATGNREVEGLYAEATVYAIAALFGQGAPSTPLQPAPREPTTCRVCHGTGRAFGPDPNKPCEACAGRGTV